MIDIQTSERNGPVVAVCKVTEDDEVMLTTSGGIGDPRLRSNTTRTIGRNTQGVRLIKLDEGDVVSSLAKLPEDEIVDVLALAPNGPLDPSADGSGLDEAGLPDEASSTVRRSNSLT